MTFKAYLLEQMPDRTVRAGFVDWDEGNLDPGTVTVRVAWSSVNYKDALAATGASPIVRRYPCIGGIDLAGTVIASADARFAVGDQVIGTGYDLGVAHHGGYAELARIPGDWLVKLPVGLSLRESMAYGTAGFTAGLAIVRMESNGLRPGNGPVLVSGATGGVGSIAVGILAHLGYDVVALTGKPQSEPFLKALGAREVMLRQDIDLSAIRPLGKATWAGAIDNLGGDLLAWMASTMQVGGALASIGLASGTQLNTTVMPFILRGVSLLGIDSVNCPMAVRNYVWKRLSGDMRPTLLTSLVQEIRLDELPTVFERYLAGTAQGRTVVNVLGSPML